ncbi:MAG: hypothetical protein R2715_19750 [Ilumatobacteraceae bacterium]
MAPTHDVAVLEEHERIFHHLDCRHAALPTEQLRPSANPGRLAVVHPPRRRRVHRSALAAS